MKTFAVFAVLGAAALTITGVAANAVPEAAVDVPGDWLKASDVTDEEVRPCWRASDDSITCPVVKRDAASQPVIAAPGGVAVFPMVKREDCSEAPDGEIQCADPSISVREENLKRGDCPSYCNPFTFGLPLCAQCFEATDSKVKRGDCPGYCNPFTFGLPLCAQCFDAADSKVKRTIKKREDCLEAADGKIECTNLAKEKRDNLGNRSLLVDKRQGDWNCWEAANAHVHCIPKVSKRQGNCWELHDGQIECTTTAPPKEKRHAPGSCWELEDGQIECTTTAPPASPPAKEKRHAPGSCWELEDGEVECTTTAPAWNPNLNPPKEKRQGNCWELEDGQIECTTTAPPFNPNPPKEKRQGNCWELEDGQIECTTTAPPFNPNLNPPHEKRTGPPCYHNDKDDSIYCVHEKRVDGTASPLS